jgi:sporulation protein YlmC with PRC-barrel domain
MRVDLDAKIRTHDGHTAGTVERAVIDPQTNEVTAFVVNTGGFLGRDVIVPRADLEQAQPDGDGLRLRLTKADLEALPTYVAEDYIPPPSGWASPGDYSYPPGAYLWPAGFPYVGFPAGFPGPAAGLGGPTSTYPGTPQEEAWRDALTSGVRDEAPDGTGDSEHDEILLPKGAIVLDRGGHDIGVVDDVRFDQASGALLGFVLRLGGPIRTLFGGGETVEVPAAQVLRVDEGTVYLRVDRDELARGGHRPPDR